MQKNAATHCLDILPLKMDRRSISALVKASDDLFPGMLAT